MTTPLRHGDALCPVSEIVGEYHSYPVGTGRVVEWSVMGDPRQEVEVCADCARPLEGGSE